MDGKKRDIADLPVGEQQQLSGRDLLAVLVKSNLANSGAKMSDEEVIARETSLTSSQFALFIMTFLSFRDLHIHLGWPRDVFHGDLMVPKCDGKKPGCTGKA